MMTIMKNLVVYFFLALGLLACQTEEKLAQKGAEYFNLPAYFKAEAQRLKEEAPAYQKVIWAKGEIDSISGETLDWEKELAIFGREQLHEPAVREDYQRDSITLENGYEIRYQSLIEKRNLQRLVLEYGPKKELQSLQLSLRQNNTVYAGQSELRYWPKKGYQLHKDQKVVAFDSAQYRLHLHFLAH